VLCYAWLVQGHESYPNSGFKAGVFSFKRIASGFQWYGHELGNRKYDEEVTGEVLEQFQDTLHSLIGEIFNPEVPFSEPRLN
jgi:hypothetical protein